MAIPARTYRVTRVVWAGPMTLMAKRKLREIRIPLAPNGVLNEEELSVYVDLLRICIRGALNRSVLGRQMKLRVIGTGSRVEGTKVLGETGFKDGRFYGRSRPRLDDYRFYPYY